MILPMAKTKTTAQVMPPEALELVAARFKVLAEPMRLRLLQLLESGERTAGQANVSKHLTLLADAGMVGRRKEGLNVYYFIADPMVFDLCKLVCGSLQKQLAQKAKAFGS
jgi:DNA-binding transcriptional ArsR family regulator